MFVFGIDLYAKLANIDWISMFLRKKTISNNPTQVKLPNKYTLWVRDNTSSIKKRFQNFSPNVRMFIFVGIFAIVGPVVLQLVKAEDQYGSVMTADDQLVVRYDTPMVHKLVQNDFSIGAPPALLLYGNGLMVCSDNTQKHPDNQMSPLSTMKQRMLTPTEVTSLFDKVRSLGFDDLLVRKLPNTVAPPMGATSSVGLITSVGERRVTIYPDETSTQFTAITQYLVDECSKATDDFNPDNVVVESIKTNEAADNTTVDLPSFPGKVSTNHNEVVSTQLTGEDAKKAKSAVSKGNKIYKTSDGKKIKVRVLPIMPSFKTPTPYVKQVAGSGIAYAEPARKVRFIYVVAADQATPANAQSVLNDLATTLPIYYQSQTGKLFSTLNVEIVKGPLTAAQYQICPPSINCLKFSTPQQYASYYSIMDKHFTPETNTIAMHSWENDGACSGVGGPLVATDNVNVANFGQGTFSATTCWHEAIQKLGAHEGGHGFGLVHTCDTTMMDGCGYTKPLGYGSPLKADQAALLRDTSPYFVGAVVPPPASPQPIASGTTYISVNPSRLLDTRPGASTIDGQFVGIGRRPAGSTTIVDVAGRASVPGDSLAASLNVAALNPSSDGYLTVYPCGIGLPNTSNVNYTTGSNVANFVISKLGSGKVCIYTSSETDLIMDVSGSFPAGSATSYTNVSPARLMDTRIGGSTIDGQFSSTGRLGADSVKELTVTNRAGIPATASAVSMNITVVNPVANGYVTIYPCDSGRPSTSNVNYTAGKVISNAVISKIGNGKVCIYTNIATDMLVDVNGAFNSVTSYSSILPSRILDSRPGTSTIDGQFVGIGRRPAGSTTIVDVAGRASVPGDSLAASLNVAALNPSSDGYLTVYPCGIGLPNTSNVNYTTGSNVANFVISKLGSGKVCIYTSSETDLIMDVSGSFVVADAQQLALSAPPVTSPNPITSDDGALATCPAGYTGTYPNCVAPPMCSGVSIYRDVNYLGLSQTMTVGKYNTQQLTVGDNIISSAKIPTGCKLTLYQNTGHTGATQVITSDWAGFSKDPWNDKASSVEVSNANVITPETPTTCLAGGVVLFKDAAFGGDNQKLSNGLYSTTQIIIGNNRLSSVKVAAGCKVILYQNSGFSGATKVLTGDWTSVTGDPWNDITSSIEVRNLK